MANDRKLTRGVLALPLFLLGIIGSASSLLFLVFGVVHQNWALCLLGLTYLAICAIKILIAKEIAFQNSGKRYNEVIRIVAFVASIYFLGSAAEIMKPYIEYSKQRGDLKGEGFLTVGPLLLTFVIYKILVSFFILKTDEIELKKE